VDISVDFSDYLIIQIGINPKTRQKSGKNRLFTRKINTFCLSSCSLAEKTVRLMIFAGWTGKSQRNEKIRNCAFETAPLAIFLAYKLYQFLCVGKQSKVIYYT
jgi:hypothetical protein